MSRQEELAKLPDNDFYFRHAALDYPQSSSVPLADTFRVVVDWYIRRDFIGND
jgi:hypothetical protein